MPTQANQHIEHLKQLDDILNYIASKGNIITFREQYFKETSENKWEVIPNPVDKYNLAYEFLVGENFITQTNDGFKMNYKGLMRLGPNSFVNEYRSQNWKNRLNHFFWIAVPTIAFVSFILSLINLRK